VLTYVVPPLSLENAMTRVTIDAVLRSKLHGLSEPLELCDESGQVVARLFPVSDLSQCEPLEPQVSDEELLRRSGADQKTYTTAEVLAHLEKL
jgi:hypothetical protein